MSACMTVGSRTLALFLLGFAGGAHADVLLEYVGADAACHGDFSRMAMSGAQMRVEPPPPEQDHVMLYDGAEKLAITLDVKNRSYFEIEMDADALEFQGDVMASTSTMVDRKLAAVGGVGGQLQSGATTPEGRQSATDMQAMIAQGMQGMSAQQREELQQAMQEMQKNGMQIPGMQVPPSSAIEPQVEAGSEITAASGIRCTTQRVTLAGELQREDCVAALDALGLQPAELQRLQKSMRNFEALSGSMAKLRIGGVSMPKQEPVEQRGLVVERQCHNQGRQTGVAHLRVSRATLPQSLFAIPADYRRMDLGAPDPAGSR